MKEDGLGRSEQLSFCNSGSTYERAKISINTTQTAWANTELLPSNFRRSIYYDLIFKDGKKESLSSYFLASRGVDLEKKTADFDIFEVSMGKGIKTNTLFNSLGGSLEYWNRFRPVVEIPMSEISINKIDGGYTPQSALKLYKDNVA